MLTTKLPTSIWSGASKLPLDWNGPTTRAFVGFDSHHLTLPVAELFETVVRCNPTKVALDDGEARLTYGEVWPLVRDLAFRVAQSTGPGDLVGILLPTSVSFEIAMLACFLAGRTFAPLDLHYPKQWVADVVDQADIKTIISHLGNDNNETSKLIPSSVLQIDVGRSLTKGYCSSDSPVNAYRCAPLGSDEPAIVLFTSGTTGRPKGIVNSQRNLLRRVEQHINAGHIDKDDRFLPLSSACTIAGMRERLTALLCGASLYCIDVQRAGVRQILQTIHQSDITIMYGLPALLRSLAQMDSGFSPTSLRLVRVGGEAVLWSDVAQLRSWLPQECLIQIGYSSSEAPIMQWFIPRDFPQEGTKAPIGYPLAGNAIAILDEAGDPVVPGDVGELVVRSPYVALGQWIDGKCDPEAFPANAEEPSCRVCHSGDLVRLRKDGLIDIVGRKDRQLKIMGQRVEPAELEAALLRSENVVDATALPRTVDDSISLIAYVVLRGHSSDCVLTDLAKSLKAALPPQLQPLRIFAIASIPRLPSGKLDMQTLRMIDCQYQQDGMETLDSSCSQRSDSSGLPEGPGGTTEDVVCAIWSRVLEIGTVGRHQDFFALGGDSLKVLRLMFELEKTFGVQLPVTMIHQFPTTSLLSRAIEQHVEPGFDPLVHVKEGSGAAPFFIVHGGGGTVMELFPVARAIRWPGRIYAIQAKGLDGKEATNRSIAEMADYYLCAIREIQPTGPYYLCGYSYGGLVAFEMGRRLRTEGQTVAFLALLDTITNPRQWPLRVWVGQMSLRLRHQALKIARMPLRSKICHLGKVYGSFRVHLRWRLGYGDDSKTAYHPPGLPPALRDVRDAVTQAVAGYRPSFYEGTVTLFCSNLLLPWKCDPYVVWKDRALHVEVAVVPGNHTTMITGENGNNLAQLLSNYLSQTQHASATQSKLSTHHGTFSTEITNGPVGVI